MSRAWKGLVASLVARPLICHPAAAVVVGVLLLFYSQPPSEDPVTHARST
jgi:hypothetical protein